MNRRAAGTLQSTLWLDRDGALEEILSRRDSGDLSQEEAAALQQFVKEGYLRFSLSLDEEWIGEFQRGVDDLWRRRPADVAFTYLEGPQSLADARPRRHRLPPYRLLDLHGHLAPARELYLHREIFRWVALVLRCRPCAVESSFAEFGWSEAPSRDIHVFPAPDPLQQASVFVALEEITPRNGCLFVVPGSHRLPVYEFAPGRVLLSPADDILSARRFAAARAAESGLSEKDLELHAGECLLLHPALIHGARRTLEPWATRRIFFIRLVPLGAMAYRDASFEKFVRGAWFRREKRLFWNRTERLSENGECVGFDAPLRGLNPRGLTVAEKLRNRFGR